MRMRLFCLAGLMLALMAGHARAGVVTFDNSDPATWSGISLTGNMRWNGTGGGHLYNEFWNDNDGLLFASPTTVNSWEMTNRPWEGYIGGTYGKIDVEMFDISNNSLWSQTIDLTNNDWYNPYTVIANVSNVSRMVFYAPGIAPHFNGFWPSIDNMTINEPVSAVPEPAAVAMWGLGAIGIAFCRRKRHQQTALRK